MIPDVFLCKVRLSELCPPLSLHFSSWYSLTGSSGTEVVRLVAAEASLGTSTRLEPLSGRFRSSGLWFVESVTL